MGDENDKTEISASASSMQDDASDSSCYGTEDEDDIRIQLGPKMSIREHLEKDKDDESLRRWKEQLLGGLDVTEVKDEAEPDVKIVELTIVADGRPDIVLEIPDDGNPKGPWFTLKEGCKYHLRFTIKVSNDIVCGLRYTNTVWKTGIKVVNGREMLGTFSPQAEPYVHEMPEETTPSGMFARGSYHAKTKFVDDDNNCHLELNYTFEIRKEWAN
ncbi:hypothetical protein SSX86_011048 [Deinandra increscens subsp. villosa]|uniref:Rho GDP-dissociation inhibitor n=1 Tax=Deinandra increscens subsp. villosa TaxID=3103831 RepID=A0AAP0D8M1_9ASTR